MKKLLRCTDEKDRLRPFENGFFPGKNQLVFKASLHRVKAKISFDVYYLFFDFFIVIFIFFTFVPTFA